MLTEEERYVQIESYLKGRLSGNSLAEFESKMKLDSSFLEEVNMHRTANEAVNDFYLLQVKDSVKKVVKQKANQHLWTKWGLGLAICVISACLLYTFYPKKEAHDLSFKTTGKTIVSSEEIKILKPVKEQVKPAHTPISYVPKRVKDSKVEKPSVEKSEALIEESSFSRLDPDVVSSKPIILKEERLVALKQGTTANLEAIPVVEIPEKKEPNIIPKIRSQPLDLVFNPMIGEEASFPIDETYNGELSIFDANGRVVFRSIVQNGYPNRWDGRMNTGGPAVSGQYGFVLKDLAGKEILQGFITIAR